MKKGGAEAPPFLILTLDVTGRQKAQHFDCPVDGLVMHWQFSPTCPHGVERCL